MKKKYLLMIGISLLVLAIIMILPKAVSAATNPEDIIKKFAPDGKNATVYMKQPTDIDESLAINGYINNLIQEDGYSVYAGMYDEPYTQCEVIIQSDDCEFEYEENSWHVIGIKKGFYKKYMINVTYVAPKANPIIDDYFKKLNDFDESNPDTFYTVEDLSVINYYLTSEKSELASKGAPGRALKYSTINNITKGSNVTYYIDLKAGSGDEEYPLYEYAFGPMSIFYNGYSYGTKTEGIYVKNRIYIPEDTANTTDAYIAAAQKRINDYLGNSASVTISYGGKLSYDGDSEEINNVIKGHDGNYYNVKIGNKTYRFCIVKAKSDKLVKPTYLGTDIASKIEITSGDSSIPLDTSLTVKNLEDKSVKDKIGTENYKLYDISLFSHAKGERITKTHNNKFSVRIPLPKELEGKALIVYYIASTGEREEHEVIIRNGYAEFETNHFSTYILAEKIESPEVETPTEPETPETPKGETSSAGIVSDTTPSQKAEKDTTPKTGVEDISNYVLTLILVSVVGIIVVDRKIRD